MVDEGVDLLRFISVDDHAGALVHQQQVLVLVDDIQHRLEYRQKEIFLVGLVKELVVDI